MNKKNLKVKDGSNISITIKNNLNANNKQINHQPIARKRRKKKVENNDEINEEKILQNLPPLKDTSYIKPGPVGAFKIWRDTMDSYNTTQPMNIPYNQATQLGLTPPPVFPALPAPPAQLALPAPPPPASERPLTFDNFINMMNLIRDNQQGPPVSWGREMVDDEDYGPIIESVPLSPVTSFSQRSLPPTPMRRERLPSQAPASEQDNNLNQSIAEVYGVKADDPEMPAVKEEVKKILTLTAARQQGTRHGNRNQPPRGDYKDMPEYQENYNKAKQ